MFSRVRPRHLAQGACAAPIFLAPLLGGTAARPHTLWVAALCGALGLCAGVLSHLRRRPLPLSLFSAALLLALCLCGLQLVPLPPPLRASLAPGSDGALRLLLDGLGAYPLRPRALSLDVGATANEAARLGSYLCLLLSIGVAFGQRGDGARLSRLVQGAAGLCALCGLLIALGVPLPPPIRVVGEGVTRARVAAGFVNSNHLAALLSIGAILCAAEVARGRGAGRPRAESAARFGLDLALLLLLNAALLLTLSRGGIAAGLLGQGAVLALRRPEGDGAGLGGGGRLRPLLLGALPMAAAVVGFLLWREARQDLAARLSSLQLQEVARPGSKLRAWVEAWPLVKGHPLLGVGRGAFDAAFQRLSSLGGSTRFVYLENEALQAVVDLGVPGALAIFALLGLALRDGLRRLREAERRGRAAGHRLAALVALVCLGLHNLVDFNLEVGGVALCAVALCAIAGRPRASISPLWLAALSAAVLSGAAACARYAPDADEDERALERLAADPSVTPEAVAEAGAAALLRHPFHGRLPALVAARLQEAERPGAVTWVSRALIASPSDVAALRTGALLLHRAGRGRQARRTLRDAIAAGTYPQRQALYRTAFALSRGPAELLEALPEDPRALTEVLEALGPAGAPWSYVREVARFAEGLGAPDAPLWLAQAALALRDVAEARRWAPALLPLQPPPTFLLANLASLLSESGEAATAEGLCRRALQRSPASPDLLVALGLVRERRGDVAEARALLQQALREAPGAEARALVHEALGAFEERRGDPARAAQERAQAARLRGR